MTIVLRADAAPPAPVLLLRPWTDADVKPLIEAYRDPVLRQFTRLPVKNSGDAAHWLDLQRHGWETGTRFSFAVLAERPGGAADLLVGNVALKRPDPGGDTAEVGYWTAGHARGQGVAPRAVQALTAWAFDTFVPGGLACLHLRHQVNNLASCRVAQKTGYAFDRVLPAQPPFPRDGHLHVRRAEPAGPDSEPACRRADNAGHGSQRS